MFQAIYEAIVEFFKHSPLIGLLAIAIIIIGALVWILVRNITKAKVGVVVDTKVTGDIDAILVNMNANKTVLDTHITDSKDIHSVILQRMDDDSRELRDTMSRLKDTMSELQNDMVRTRERVTDAGANTAIAIKSMVGQMQRLVDQVINISGTLKTIIADVFRDRIGQKIDEKDRGNHIKR